MAEADKDTYEHTAEGDHLSVVGQNLPQIPLSLSKRCDPSSIRVLDLSHNSIQSIDNLGPFPLLTSLILDNNILQSQQKLPSLKTLQTLSVNNNNIDDLRVFMDSVSSSFPNLTYLSMLKNPACPNYFMGKDNEDYQRYRYYVLYRMKQIKFLDSTSVTQAERKEAARVGQYMIPPKPQALPQTLASKPASDHEEEPEPAPLPDNVDEGISRGPRFGVSSYVYYGKHSEGNRFITNDQL